MIAARPDVDATLRLAADIRALTLDKGIVTTVAALMVTISHFAMAQADTEENALRLAAAWSGEIAVLIRQNWREDEPLVRCLS